METLVSVDSSNLVSGSTTTEVAVAEAEAATLLSVADVEGEEVAAEENGWAGDSLPDGAFFPPNKLSVFHLKDEAVLICPPAFPGSWAYLVRQVFPPHLLVWGA
jgi:hypothetical protein